MDLCRGVMSDAKTAPRCQRRTECVHYRATLEWLATQADFAPDLPEGWTIAHRLCQTTEFERFQRREGGP